VVKRSGGDPCLRRWADAVLIGAIMPPQQSSNGIAFFALGLSTALAGVVGIMLWRDGSQAPVPAPAPASPAPTPTPAAPAPTPTATETPAPTASPTPAEAAPTSQAPAPATLVVALRRADGSAHTGEAELELDLLFDDGTRERSTVTVADGDSLELSGAREARAAVLVAGSIALAPQTIALAEGSTASATFTVPGRLALRGRVLDDTGAPITGIPVDLLASYGASAAPPVSGVTDDFGFFNLETAAAPRAEIRVRREGPYRQYLPQAPLALTFTTLADASRTDLIVALVRGESFEGRVMGADGSAISGAAVRDLGTDSRTETTAGGRFLLEGLPRGTRSFEVSAPGYLSRRIGNVSLPAAPMEITLQRAAVLELEVAAADPGTAPRALRYAIFSGDGATTGTMALAAGRGTASLGNLGSGTHEIVLYGEGGGVPWSGRTRVTLVPGETLRAPSVALRPMRTETFPVVAPDTLNLAEVEVTVSAVDDTDSWSAAKRASYTPIPPPRGAVAVGGLAEVGPLEDGREYLVTFRQRGRDSVAGGIVVSVPLTERPVAMLFGTGSVAGTVLNERKLACAGARVELVLSGAAIPGETARQERRTTVADFEGRFAFPAVPVGRARLVVNGDEGNARVLAIQPDLHSEQVLACRNLVPVRLAVEALPEAPIRDGEIFLLMNQAGSETRATMLELTAPRFEAALGPGHYSLVRASTMQRRPFQVRLDTSGPIAVSFATPDETPFPSPTPVDLLEELLRSTPTPATGARTAVAP
jgi:hypothetical protein